MPGDWDDRIRSSSDYIDRRSDQIEFERTQASSRDAVYDGIITGDDMKTRSALGITPGANVRFDEYVASLVDALQSSDLPDAAQWAARLTEIEHGASAQRLLHEFATAYDRFYQVRHGSTALEIEKDRIVQTVRALWEMVGGP